MCAENSSLLFKLVNYPKLSLNDFCLDVRSMKGFSNEEKHLELNNNDNNNNSNSNNNNNSSKFDGDERMKVMNNRLLKPILIFEVV